MSPARVTDYDRAHMADILQGKGDWFSAQLIRLIAKSDFENKARIRLAFPDHVLAFEQWERDIAVRDRIEMVDPLVGTCARCGKEWHEHRGGFCPGFWAGLLDLDAVGTDGMVAVNERAAVPAEGGRRMSDMEIREREELALPHTGELVDLSDEVACATALDELRRMNTHIEEAVRALSRAVAARAAILGTKTIQLPGGRKAEVKGGKKRIYDAEQIERELRVAGCPDDRIRQIVREEVTHTVVAVEAKRAAGANEEYALIIARNMTEVDAPYSVTIRRR
jgi:hypothetical protein